MINSSVDRNESSNKGKLVRIENYPRTTDLLRIIPMKKTKTMEI